MTREPEYDVLVIGGGLAGLALAIQLRSAGYNVIIMEKDNYPRHKVCGEYISTESKPFLQRIGLQLSDMQLPAINTLQVSDTKGLSIHTALPQGGFGISRYKLDAALATLVQQKGGILLTDTKADEVQFADGMFSVKAGNKIFSARVVCGTWGKRSNMDIKLQRPFMQQQKKALNNYVGVKYHIRYPWPEQLIALHNFRDGYCGISRIEDDKCCLCYLTTAANLQESGNDIKKMEQHILMQNPHLQELFANADFLFEHPLTISQISFERKGQVQDHILMLGDAAGMISPLCGNGMSMAFHASLIAFDSVNDFLQRTISRQQMENTYTAKWKVQFSKRLSMGRFLQSRFGKERTTAVFLGVLRTLPFLQRPLISTTSGKPF